MTDLDYFIVILYLVAVLGIGIWSGRKVRNLEGYAVGTRAYPAIIVFATLSASFIGGGFTIGSAEKVFLIGIANIVALWGFSLKEILVAKVIAPRIKAFPKAISPGDVMEENFGKIGKFITGIFSVLLCAGILGAQVGAIGYIFNLFLGIPAIWGILIGVGIVLAYDIVGGMKAVIATDVLQFCVLIIGIPLALIFGINAIGGWGEFVAAVPADNLKLFGQISPLALFSLFLTFLLGETLVPPYVRRLFIGKNVKAVEKGTFWSGMISIPFFAITGMIGLVALVLEPSLNANLALPYVIQETMPIGLLGIVIAGVIAITMSSADSFLNSASVAVVNDVVNPLRKKDLTPKAGLRVARIAALATGVLSIYFAVSIESILDILIYAYNFWAPVILVPLAATLLGVRAGLTSFIGSALCGVLGVITWGYLVPNSDFDGLLIGFFASLISFMILKNIEKK